MPQIHISDQIYRLSAINGITLLVIELCVGSCALPDENRYTAGDLTGKWQSLSLDITVILPDNNVDSIGKLLVPEGEWEKIMAFKPIITEYLPDSSYVSTYYSLDGTMIMNRQGIWWIEGNSLFMTDGKTLFSYKIKIESEKSVFESILDWDQDGREDDQYKGVLVKIK